MKRLRVGVQFPLFRNAGIFARDLDLEGQGKAALALTYLAGLGFYDGKRLGLGAVVVFRIEDR